MEQFTDYIPFIIKPNVADEYLHRVVCAPKRIVVAQRPTPTKGRENERINLKEDNYVYRSRTFV